jgi:tetratricopeptide (TPR) repeat protein
VTSKASTSPREVYSESLYARNHFGCSSLRSLRLGRYKYIEAPKPEFYDLQADPGEQHNLYFQQSSMALTYRERLQALRSRFRMGQSAQSQAVSPEAAAALNSLGYVAVSSANPNSLDSGPDPKERITDFESNRRAIDLSSAGRLAEANELFEKLCSKYPEIADLRISLGVNQRRLGQNREAVESFRRVLKLDALNMRAHFDLAVSLFELRQLDNALKEVQVVLAMAPYYNRATELLGTILIQKKDYAGARTHFDQMLKSDPGNYLAHYQIGTLATQEGKLEEAERHLSSAVTADPKSVEAYNGLGVLYLLSGKLEQAREAFMEAIHLEPGFAETHYNLGLVLRKLSRKDEAAREFRAALAADPQFRPAREALSSPEFRAR